jgi:dienelactone hydrolase
MEAYQSRPPYQQNDYVGWITRARRPETRDKRLAQMLDELEGGTLYMNMAHRPSTRKDTMTSSIPALANAKRGTTSSGVPFVALPPEAGQEAEGLVIAWHGGDPPRSEEALAAAVPMQEVPAWRVYLGMPLYSGRLPEGGFEEVRRRAGEDAVKLIFHPIVAGAVDELPAALDEIRAEMGIDPALPLGVFGFSQGGAAALLALARQVLPFKAAVTFGAPPDFRGLVDAVASFYNISYDWTEERRTLVEQISTAHRPRDLASSSAAILLAAGANDPYPVREPLEQLAHAIQAEGGSAELRVVPDLAHAFVDEPGTAAAPQGPQAQVVDELATDWFIRHLT